MKSMIKRTSCLMVSLLCMAALLFGIVGTVWAEETSSAATQLISTAESLTDAIIEMTDEDIENYSQSTDSFTQAAMTAWSSAKDELGAKAEDQTKAGESSCSESDGTYTVTVPVAFEKSNAEFVYTFDETGTPTGLSVDVQYSMAETLRRAAMNTVMGLGTVFLVLFFLTFVIWLFRFIPNGSKAPAPAAEAPAVQTVEAEVAESEPEVDDGELVAVIAAAIAAAEGTTTDGFVVRSIRKVNRKKW